MQFVFFYNRDIGQGTAEEIKARDMKRELEERERSVKSKTDRKDRERSSSSSSVKAVTAPSTSAA